MFGFKKKKESVADNIRQFILEKADEARTVDLTSEGGSRYIDNLKTMSEILGNVEKADNLRKSIAKDIGVAVISSGVGAGVQAGIEYGRERNEVKMQGMRISAREDELVACLAQENGYNGMAIEKINSSPTLKKYWNQTLKP